MGTPRKKRSRKEQTEESEGNPPAKRQDTSKTPQPPAAPNNAQAPPTPAVPVPQQNMQVIGVALSREVTIPVESDTKVQQVDVGLPPADMPESVPAIAPPPPTTAPLPETASPAKPITDEAVVLSWEKQLAHAEAEVGRLQKRLDLEFCRWGTVVLFLVFLFSVVTGLWIADRIQFQIATADLRQHLQECQVLTSRVRDEYYVEELETQVRDWKQTARAKDVELESLRNVCVTAISNLAHE